MAVTEQQRHQLLTWFEERMGEERAATMMELLPSTGRSELATKADVAELRAEVKSDLFALQRTLGTWLFASQAAVIAAIGVAAGVIVALA